MIERLGYNTCYIIHIQAAAVSQVKIAERVSQWTHRAGAYGKRNTPAGRIPLTTLCRSDSGCHERPRGAVHMERRWNTRRLHPFTG